MVDRFSFRAPLGVLGWLAEQLVLTRYLTGLLLTRNRYLKQVAEAGMDPAHLVRQTQELTSRVQPADPVQCRRLPPSRRKPSSSNQQVGMCLVGTPVDNFVQRPLHEVVNTSLANADSKRARC